MAVIRCRAEFSEECEEGCTTTMDTLREDSTWDGRSILCNACYILIEPLMKMNAPSVVLESNNAVRRYREALAYVGGHSNPAKLVEEADAAANESYDGSPRHKSALFLKSLAEAEVERRQK